MGELDEISVPCALSPMIGDGKIELINQGIIEQLLSQNDQVLRINAQISNLITQPTIVFKSKERE